MNAATAQGSTAAMDSSTHQDAVADAGGAMETAEVCVDSTPLIEALVLEKTKIQASFDDCDSKRTRLEHLMEGLEVTVEKQSKVLDGAGGEKGIQKLLQAAEKAGDADSALAEAEARETEASEKAEKAEREADAAKREARAAAEEADAAKNDAERLASEMESLQGKLDAADKELETLTNKILEVETQESKTREELTRHTEDIRGKLERTASELELAKRPRVVSMSAIYGDLKQLGDDLVDQSRDARKDIVRRASQKFDEARELAQPHVDAVVEISAPIVKTAMDKTEPHRTKAGEVFASYRGKVDEQVGAPVAKKWSSAKAEASKAWQKANSWCEEVGEALVAKLVSAGVPKGQAEKTCKYLNIGLMCLIGGVFCWYMLTTTVVCVVWPVLRTVLRIALWAVILPLRILFLPVRLVLWVVLKCFRMVFGGGGSAAGAGSGGGSKKSRGGKNSKKNR
ncbi:unnamed protein product [Pylaiella littoralis]